MPLLQWDTKYSVGVAELDKDHRSLFGVLNDLWRVIEEQSDRTAVLAAIRRVQAGMAEHFAREEACLRQWKYPRTQRHIREHRRLLDKLGALARKVADGEADGIDARSFEFIGHWLSSHILASDNHYARFAAEAPPPAGRLPQGRLPQGRLPQGFGGWTRIRWTILAGLAVSAALFAIVDGIETRNDELRFQELAEQRIIAIRSNIDIALDGVALLAGHFGIANSDETGRSAFRRMVAPTLARHRFIQAFSWDPRIRLAQRQAFEARVRADGLSDFVIAERDAEGGMRPAGERESYVAVLYIEPAARNAQAIGFDLASDPVRKVALDLGRDTASPQATGRIRLVQESGDQYGVLVLAPVYRADPGEAAAERDQLLRGYVSGVFRIGDLIAESRAKAERRSNQATGSLVDVHLFDLSAPSESDRQLFPIAPDTAPARLAAGRHLETTFEVAGRSWQIVATPGKGMKSPPFLALATLCGALLITAFIAYHQKNDAERIARSALFAREIARAKQQLSEAHRIARLGMMELDPGQGDWLLGEGLQDMLGLDRAMVRGSLEEVFAKADPDDFAGLKQRLAEGGKIARELRIGERVVQVLGDGGAIGPDGLPQMLTFQDVTQRHAMEKEREAIAARIAEIGRLESLGTLAGGVAHEINTPAQFIGDNLAFIAEWLPALLEVVKNARAAAASGDWRETEEGAMALRYDFAARELPAAAEQALGGIARISTIVEAIKAFSYPSGREPQPFDLNHAVEMAGTVTRNQWKYVAELELDLAPDLPRLNGIEGEINQVLVNLIMNAAQAVEEKAADSPGRITVSTRAGAGTIELTVADTGVGIPPGHLEHLFELFFTTKPPGKGTGQGLAITRAIVLRHGGAIAVESTPGAGACFRVRLPIAGPQGMS